MSLKLEVDRLAVLLASLAGDKRRTTFFVPVPDSVTSPFSCLTAQLDDPAIEFLPCRIDERTSLIRCDWIAYVEVESDRVDWVALEQAGGISTAIELDLVTGERLAGHLMMEGPEYARRVSDYLNRSTIRFVLLRTSAAAFYVNRRAVARVHLHEP